VSEDRVSEDGAGARGVARAARFTIGDREFLLDGEPFRILAGALHYFRVHPGHWADRIRKARQMGLNTIETYVAWNAHAPREGDFDLTGGLDLGRFLDLVAAQGMRAVVRPGPYICAEWNNGGLPAWLLRRATVGIRRDEPTFLAAVRDYFERLAPVLVPRQVDRGGPIILVQVENEYGAYGADKAYLRRLVALNRGIGLTVPLTSVDQPTDGMLDAGSLPELHKTGSFGSRVAQRLETLRRHQPTGPLMCSEFWDGWFDDWGGRHHLTPVAQTARDLDELLARGASVNIYMFHGGTNFGFTNGANDKGTYQPITTSYDYDAPLNEAGNPTPKYWAFRDVLARYAPVGDDRPDGAPPSPAFTVPFTQCVALWDVVDGLESVDGRERVDGRRVDGGRRGDGGLGRWSRHDVPPTADALGHYEGFTLYRTGIDLAGPGVLCVEDVRDRAQVFVERRSVGILARDHHDHCVTLPTDARGVLELLVEDQGRVDYGPRLGEPKGLIGAVTTNGQELRGWDVLPLDLTDIATVAHALRRRPPDAVPVLPGPVFARASFDLPAPGDLHLDTGRWGKGVAWINGFCLGRYWSRGPQRTLYVPGPVLREADNELIVLELHGSGSGQAGFVSAPDLGHTES
jgi:beta-galactosidase